MVSEGGKEGLECFRDGGGGHSSQPLRLSSHQGTEIRSWRSADFSPAQATTPSSKRLTRGSGLQVQRGQRKSELSRWAPLPWILLFGESNLNPWGSWISNPVFNLIFNPTTGCQFTNIFKPGQEIIVWVFSTRSIHRFGKEHQRRCLPRRLGESKSFCRNPTPSKFSIQQLFIEHLLWGQETT